MKKEIIEMPCFKCKEKYKAIDGFTEIIKEQETQLEEIKKMVDDSRFFISGQLYYDVEKLNKHDCLIKIKKILEVK